MISGKTQLAVRIILQRFSPACFTASVPFQTCCCCFLLVYRCIWMQHYCLDLNELNALITVEVCSDWSSAHSPVLSLSLSLPNRHTHTPTHTHDTNSIGFFLRGCLCCSFSSLVAVSPSSLWLNGHFFSRLTWQIHIWLHWSVVAPSFFVHSFFILTLVECVWRIKTSLWLVGGTERFPPRGADGAASILLSDMDWGCQGALAERGSLHQPHCLQISVARGHSCYWLVRMWAPGMIAGT